MGLLERVRELERQGLPSEALRLLCENPPAGSERLSADLTRAKLLEATGQYEAARSVVGKLLSLHTLTPSQRSLCEYVLGRAAMDKGPTDEAISHFQRSAMCAQDSADTAAEFDARLQLFLLAFERAGASGPLLSDIRGLATKLADSACTAKLHLFVGVMEARRELLANAKRHLTIARRLLDTKPNTYLEAFAANMEFGMAIMQSDYEAARLHGNAALECAEKAGLALMTRAIEGNLGALHLAVGEFEIAERYLVRAAACESGGGVGHNGFAPLETLASLRLIQGRLGECSDALDIIQTAAKDRRTYVFRDAELTRSRLLATQDNEEQALDRIDSVLALCREVGDTLLITKASIQKAQLLQQYNKSAAAVELLERSFPKLDDSPELFARSEHIFACALIRQGDKIAAHSHRDRALRICDAAQSVTARRLFRTTVADSV